MLKEITDYIFLHNPEVKFVKVKIAKDNIASIKTASSCGFNWIGDDYYELQNPHVKQNKFKK